MTLNQMWLVTGASRGIGLAIVQQLVQLGHHVIATARDSDDLSRLTTTKDIQVIACDLAVKEDIQRLCTMIHEFNRPLSGIVFNAGQIHPILPIHDLEIDAFEHNLRVNLTSVQEITRGVWSSLVEAKRARITTISSGASQRAIGSWSAYCVAKAGLDMWTKTLSHEGQSQGISAISIAPGIVDTNMQQEIRETPSHLFPLQSTFQGYFDHGELANPDDVATKLIPKITLHHMDESGSRFDVRDF